MLERALGRIFPTQNRQSPQVHPGRKVEQAGALAVQETVIHKILAGLAGGLLSALALVLLWPAYGHLKGEATVYRMFCASDRADDRPCALKDELTATTETYKAFPDQQSVIVWIGNDAPSKLTNCAVRDAMNWRCTNRDKQGGSLEQSMAEGQLSETVDGNPSPSLTLFYQTSRWRWWLVKMLQTARLRK